MLLERGRDLSSAVGLTTTSETVAAIPHFPSELASGALSGPRGRKSMAGPLGSGLSSSSAYLKQDSALKRSKGSKATVHLWEMTSSRVIYREAERRFP